MLISNLLQKEIIRKYGGFLTLFSVCIVSSFLSESFFGTNNKFNQIEFVNFSAQISTFFDQFKVYHAETCYENNKHLFFSLGRQSW